MLTRSTSTTLVLAVLAVACGGDDVCEAYPQLCGSPGGNGSGGNGSGGSVTTSGGGGAGAAGGEGGQGGDGGDGGQGGQPPPVDVNVEYRSSGGAALGGRRVLVSDDEGEPLQTLTLTKNGTVTVEDVMPGSMITVFEEPGATDPQRYAYAFVVTAGTSYARLIHDVPIPENASVGNVTIQSYCGICSGTMEAIFAVSCASPQTLASPTLAISRTFSNYRGCPGKTSFDAHLTIRNGNQVIAHQSRTNIPLSAGVHGIGEVEEAMDSTSLAWGIAGAPAGSFNTRRIFATGGLNGPVEIHRSQDMLSLLNVAVHDPFASPGVLVTTVFDGITSQASIHVRSSALFDLDTLTFDVGALARVNDVMAVDTTDPLRPAYDWSLEGGPLGDFVVTGLGAGIGGTGAVWYIAQPPSSSGTMKIPVLEGELLSFVPSTASNATIVVHVGLAAPLGYGAVLQSGIDLTSLLGGEVAPPFPEYAYTSDLSIFGPP